MGAARIIKIRVRCEEMREREIQKQRERGCWKSCEEAKGVEIDTENGANAHIRCANMDKKNNATAKQNIELAAEVTFFL